MMIPFHKALGGVFGVTATANTVDFADRVARVGLNLASLAPLVAALASVAGVVLAWRWGRADERRKTEIHRLTVARMTAGLPPLPTLVPSFDRLDSR